ncbi:hypothetical protein STK_17420 [Sulfurisphaera tokodaii str. 7]|uniref:DUF998 domain-containing protein n=3 Tax=Sulfurisphaera tokodaii TaxID=111955 RepID=Q96ZU3_SULTO|nr:DUF998 domain-containing protein [Sulfurisphaera tokodaii]BAB66830.1 hypothetical protein STK_17420 [Sulfurisphaera tokodaii str. 7]HII73360.1 DUF998 domain-containing protein [Sulfurisphaera tokodaii]
MSMDRIKISGYMILIGISQFLLLMIIAEILYPNYSVKYNYISDLGVGRTAIIFNTSIVVMGILVMLGSLLLRTYYYPLLFLIGLGSAIVGIFPETTGLPHLIGALLAFLFGGISAILTSIRRNYFWTVLGLITLISLVLYVLKDYGPLGPGGMERMIVYPEIIWGISFATYLTNKT